MISDDLFKKVLINPAKNGCNELYIVSGYATSAMAFHHLDLLKTLDKDISINLLVGMCPTDGISLSNHRGFQQLMEKDFPTNFKCSYIMKNPSVHSKTYSWFSDDKPVFGFVGSANYTQNAFGNKQRELVGSCDPVESKVYFDSLIDDSIYCIHSETENFVKVFHDKYYLRRKKAKELLPEIEEIEAFEDIAGLASLKVSLLDRTGEIQNKAGLNWGQRKGRDPNQAYIQLSPDVYKSNFFPLKTIHFTVLTDDDKTLICTRAQKNDFGATIETPHNNSLLGEYFRNRLGLPNGSFVKTQDLINYGRTDVTFYKIDDENYYLDFSV